MKRFSMVILILMLSLMVTACGGGSSSPSNPAILMGGAVQGKALSLANMVTTIAGSAAIYGTVEGVPLSNPNGITSDGTNLYVADANTNTIRKVVISTRTVTTIAGMAEESGTADGTGTAARFDWPAGITIDGDNLFVTDRRNNTIRKVVISTGVVTTIAGTAGMSGAADGIGAAASFITPKGITTDGANLYVSDSGNHTIRKVVIATGEVTTLAGTAGVAGSADGIGAAARFNQPYGIVKSGADLFVADANNCLIRKIVIATGEVTTLAGTPGVSGSGDGIGAAASFTRPYGIASDGSNLFISDAGDHTIRKIVISTKEVSTIAGTAWEDGAVDGIGSAARFSEPYALVSVGSNLFVSDSANNLIRKVVVSTGAVSTIVGAMYVTGATDGIGAAASFYGPSGITSDGSNLFVADSANNLIRKVVVSTGAVTTIAGTVGVSGATDGVGAAAKFNYPGGITTDGTNLYVTDMFNHTIRKIVISTGMVSTIAGTAGVSGASDGTGTAARFDGPVGITTDGANLFVTEMNNYTIRKIAISTGVVTTIAGTAGISGATDGTGAAASFGLSNAIVTDGANLYVTDSSNQLIRKVVISSGVVTTIAGTAGISGTADGTGAVARFNYPTGITTDGANLFVTDTLNNTIRKVVISTGMVTTITGAANISGVTDGSNVVARFYWPTGITTDGTSLFITDSGNSLIRKIR